MKYNKLLSVLFAGVIASSSVSLDVIANTGVLINTDDSLQSDSDVVLGSGFYLGSTDNVKAANDNSYLFGSSNKALPAGTYNLPVAMKNASNIANDSMAASCVKGGTLTVDENGKAKVTVDLQAVTVFGTTAWASDWKIYQGTSASGDSASAEPHTNSDGETDQITFEVPDNSYDGVYVNMLVSAMNTRMDGYFAFDFSACGEDESVVNTYKGTVHVDQFGEYDVNVTVTVTDDIITGISVEGSNFNGSSAEYNKTKLQTAFEGLKDSFNGKSAKDASAINNVDAVTGATYSSKAIKSAILNALKLAVEEEIINIPTERLAQGEYTVDIAFYTDKVEHSLIENEKAKAVIKVDADGNLTLSTDIINGKSKEPLYVLNFNGYYENNNTANLLKTDADIVMGKTKYSDDVFKEDTPVVTKVTFPLEGDYSKIYNTNASIYVPAMKALTGSISGIEFDKGVFTADCFAKIYWDSINKIPETEPIADGNYTADISMLKIDSDETSSAERSFNTTAVPIEVKNGRAYVRLAYTSSMIEKIEQMKNGEYTELTKNSIEDGSYVTVEFDNISDIVQVQFTINTGTSYGTMVNQARVKINTDTLKKMENSDMEQSKKYSVPVKMVNAANPSAMSMGNGALDGNAIITIKDGKSMIDLSFKAVTISNLYGHLLKMWSYPAAENINNDWWDNPTYEIPAEIIETYTDYGLNYTIGDKTQSEFVKKMRLERNGKKENFIYVRINVDAMTGFDQSARLDFDWDKATEIEESVVIYGDADGDGTLTASDAAIILQKVRMMDFKTPIENKGYNYMILDVTNDGKLTATDAATVLQKALDNSFIMPCEKYSERT